MILAYFAKRSIADGDDFVRPLDTEKAGLHERNKMTGFANTPCESPCRQGQGLTHRKVMEETISSRKWH